jgi:hypothetical protein
MVLYVISWSVVLLLLALWSLAAWGFHAVAVWTVANSGALAGSSGAVEGWRAPDWLAPWLPPELALAFTSMLSAFVPAIEALLGQAPALAGGLSVAIWVIWGIGAVLLLALGLVCSGFIAVLRRRRAGSPLQATQPSGGPSAR